MAFNSRTTVWTALIPVVTGATLTMLASPAVADVCRERISAMLDGGALDPAERTPHRLINTVSDSEGNFIRRFITVWQTPARSMSGVEGSGMVAMVIDRDTWIGPTLEGPWTQAPNQLPENHGEVRDSMHEQMRANISEAECQDAVPFEGGTYDMVSYVTRTEPNPEMNDAWFGSRNAVYIDPEKGHVAWWVQTEMISSFQPEGNNEVHVSRFEYDPEIVIERPE